MGHIVESLPGRRLLIVLAAAIAAMTSWPSLLRADPAANPPNWSAQQQQAFYTTDQGSRIIPIFWFLALNKADGSGLFAADGLARYGYLPNPKSASNPYGLPVGFMVANDIAAYSGRPTLAMNCAACHTRELIVNGQPMRIDGGPAIVDFYGLLSDLDAAMQVVVNGDGFNDFAHRVLGSKYTAAAAATLKQQVAAWFTDYDGFMKSALPTKSWGPARLDAFGMIFNRLSGIDLHQPTNVVPADAPVRYPFLWNASRQDKTQWNGAVKNGLFTLGMGRNLGEVYGVFGRLTLTANDSVPGWVNFAGPGNSANFHNLQRLETLISRLPPPRYPLPTDPALVKRGAALFVSEQCANCHLPVPGKFNTWKTPVTAEGTDSRMYNNAQNQIKVIGLLDNVSVPQVVGTDPLGPNSKQVAVLSTTVANTLLEELSRHPDGVLEAVLADIRLLTTPPGKAVLAAQPTLGPGVTPQTFLQSQVRDLYGQAVPDQNGAAYESRVLYGIWAAAPYLHNGSVPSLWALLQKPADRPKSFGLGSNTFDPKNVGLDTTVAAPFNYTYTATSCDNVNDGNSNCGHWWGTELSDDDKWALIEYMKQL
ncbi:MAG TPA: di-heme-cytochrome C peroxidase [Stellaceae bacterium]|nr:di-heme-cytochrome C peroxidase [Stellaceae bacterium]